MKYACLCLLLMLPLAACQRAAEPVAPERDRAAVQADAINADEDQPRDDVPPATAPPGTLPPRLQQGGQSLARFDGYGDLVLGMDAAQLRQRWGGELKGGAEAGADESGCYYLMPQWADDAREFGFMVEGGKLVRYDSSNPKELAPGGGRVGMTVQEIEQRYAGRVQAQPHKYVTGAQYLRIGEADQAGVLVFETDEAGRVQRWRVGLPPQVDYVEGCG